MKKKIFTLMVGLGMAFGATNAAAYACVCDLNFTGCLEDGGSYNGCMYKYNHCMDIHGWDANCSL